MTLISNAAPSTEQNKAIVRRDVDEVANRRNLAAIDELITADYLHHSYRGISLEPRGPAFVRDDVAALSAVFAEAHWTIEDLIAEGDKVVIAGQPRVFTKVNIWESQQQERLSP